MPYSVFFKHPHKVLRQSRVLAILAAMKQHQSNHAMDDFASNRLRSIKQLAVIDGWFEQESTSSNRYSLHLNASFRTERLGGVAESNVHFRIRLKQCEIVVVLPESGRGFVVDPRTLARTKPVAPVTISQKTQTTQSGKATGTLGVNPTGPSVSLNAKAEKEVSESVQIDQTQERDFLETLHSRSDEGHPSWIVTSPVKVLNGSLWDPVSEPRFTIIDQRSNGEIEAERAMNISPNAVVQIRCKSEDVEIFDIDFKDSERASIFRAKANQINRQRAAEAFLKCEIQNQRLKVGDIRDKFSEMTLAEFVVPLFI